MYESLSTIEASITEIQGIQEDHSSKNPNNNHSKFRKIYENSYQVVA